MTEPPGVPLRAALALLAAFAGGAASAQEPSSTAERARAAFGTGAPETSTERIAAQAEAEAAAEEAAESLGVDLLSTRLVEAGERRLIMARVMEPAGDANTAFLVQTLVLDPESGVVLGVFPGTEDEVLAMPDLPAAAGAGTAE